MAPQAINWAIYNSLPPKEAGHQLANIHDNKRRSLAITLTICYLISFGAVIMRFISKRVGRIQYRADDWSILAALILASVGGIASILGIFRYGGARHTILMSENDLISFGKSAFAAEILYAPSIGVVKISTLLIFARIFPGKKFKRTLWAVGLFIAIYSVVMVIPIIFQCTPIHQIWDGTLKKNCVEVNEVFIVMGSLNVLTDFIILYLPLPQLWRLQLRKATKIQLIGVFSIGSFATAISIYRMPKLRTLTPYSYDPTWDDIEPDRWSFVEVSAGILGACAITFQPLFKWVSKDWIRKIGSSLPRSGSNTSRADYFRPSVANRSRSKIQSDIEMQPLGAIRPTLPPQAYHPPQPSGK